jgi:cell division protein FtsI (penicillin-binding protein 3)
MEVKKGHPSTDQPLVIDVPKYHVHIDPMAIPLPYKEEMVKVLTEQFHIEEAKSHLQRETHSRRIAKFITEKERLHLLSWWDSFRQGKGVPSNALYFIQDYERSYPFGHLLGPILHTLREDKVPTGGLEFQYNEVLKGKESKRLLLRSPRHPMDIGKVIEEGEEGADVYLTINHYLQAICEEEVAKGVEQVHAKAGWAVMMNPKTGEILALAQYPFFEPENYQSYFNNPSLIDRSKVKALTDCNEPGSTMKPISCAIALLANEERKKRKEPFLFDPNVMERSDNGNFPGRTRPMKDVGHHPFSNMDIAMQKSSNIYVAHQIKKVIDTLGDAWYRTQLEEVFGFGKKTGLELPGESSGFLPTPGKMYASRQLEWSKPTPYSLAIGYNLLVNAVQMTRAYAIIANGGYAVEPTLIRKVKRKDEVIYENPFPRKRVLSEAICKRIVHSMKFVTKPGGMGVRGAVTGYTSAGKTSTSEKIVHGAYSKTLHFVSFLGFAPADHPELVLFVGIDEPEAKNIPGYGKTNFGGKAAAPIFKQIMHRSLEYLGIPPDDLEEKRKALDDAVQVLKKTYDKYNARP